MVAARAVVERWKKVVVDEDEGLTGVQQEPATEETLAAFEARHGVRLPTAFRALYALSNGTTEMDGHEQIFWPLSAIDNVLRSFDAGDPAAHWIGFADFRLQATVFYLRIDRADGAATVWIDRASKKKKPFPSCCVALTDSFDAFLAAYAKKPLFWK
jgi:hypothetical protein